MRVLVVVLALLTVACDIEIEVDVFASDLESAWKGRPGAVEGESPVVLEVPARVRFEVADCTQDDHFAAIVQQTQSVFSADSKAKFVGCKNVGMTSLVEFSLAIALTAARSNRDIVISPQLQGEGTDKETMDAMMWINPRLKGRIREMVSSRMQSIDFDDLSVSIDFLNDYRQPLTLMLDGAFANGKPYLTSINGKLNVAPRERVSLEFLSLHSYLLWQGSDWVVMLGTRQGATAAGG